MPVYYFEKVDLENAIGKEIVKSIYDDDQDTVPETAPLDACRAYGTSMANSFLRVLHPSKIPTAQDQVTDELKFAALEFGIAYTMRRRPDLVRAMGEESWTAFLETAIAQMKRYVQSEQRMPSTEMGTPTNVGGEVVTTVDEADEPDPPTPGVFSDMGDF